MGMEKKSVLDAVGDGELTVEEAEELLMRGVRGVWSRWGFMSRSGRFRRGSDGHWRWGADGRGGGR